MEKTLLWNLKLNVGAGHDPGRLSQVRDGDLHHHRAPLCDGFNVQVVYTDLPNDRFQLVMMLSKAGRRRRFASRFGGLLAGVFSASFTALGIPADVPALKFALQVWKAFVIRPLPKIGATRSTHFALAGLAAFVSVHTLSARMP